MGKKEFKDSKKPPKRKRKKRTRRKKRIYLLLLLIWKPQSSSLPLKQQKCLKFRINQRILKRARLNKTLPLKIPSSSTSARQYLFLLIQQEVTLSSQNPPRVKHRVINRVCRDLSQMQANQSQPLRFSTNLSSSKQRKHTKVKPRQTRRARQIKDRQIK